LSFGLKIFTTEICNLKVTQVLMTINDANVISPIFFKFWIKL